VNGSLLGSSDNKGNMAEKITARKEYRGLGYAPAISVPGLIQERPVAATRPPATNQLTKLAKSLSDFGEVFSNTKLRQASIQDEQDKQLAKEYAAAIVGGKSFRKASEEGSQRESWAKGDIADKGPEIADARSLILLGNDPGIQALVETGAIPATATPAFFAYLKREMAKRVIATDYRKALFSKLEESADISSEVDNEARRRDIIEEVSADLEKEFGTFWTWAPDEFTKVDVEFTQRSQDLVEANKEKLSAENFQQNFGTSVDRWMDSRSKWAKPEEKEKAYKKLGETLKGQIAEAKAFGVGDIGERTGDAAKLAINKLLVEEQIEEAQQLFEFFMDFEGLGIGPEGRGAIPLISRGDEEHIRSAISNAKRLNESLYPKRRARIEALAQARIAAFEQSHPQASLKEKEAFLATLLKKQFPLLNEKNEDGSPKTLSLFQLDPALYSEDLGLLKELYYRFRATSATRKGQADALTKDINDLLKNPSELIEGTASIELAQDRLDEAREWLDPAQYSKLSDNIFNATAVPEITRNIALNNLLKNSQDALTRIALNLPGDAAIDNESGIGKEEQIAALQGEFQERVTNLAVSKYQDWMQEFPELAKKDALERGKQATRAIKEAGKEVLDEMKTPSEVAALFKRMKDENEVRKQQFDKDWWDSFSTDRQEDQEKIRKKSVELIDALGIPEGDSDKPLWEQLEVLKERFPKYAVTLEKHKKVLEELTLETQANQRKARKKLNNSIRDYWKETDPEARKEIGVEIRGLLSVTNLTIEEVISGNLYPKKLDKSNRVLGIDRKARSIPFSSLLEKDEELTDLINPFTTAMFANTAELFYAYDKHDEAVERGEKSELDRALDALGIAGDDPKERSAVLKSLILTQLETLRGKALIADYQKFKKAKEKQEPAKPSKGPSLYTPRKPQPKAGSVEKMEKDLSDLHDRWTKTMGGLSSEESAELDNQIKDLENRLKEPRAKAAAEAAKKKIEADKKRDEADKKKAEEKAKAQEEKEKTERKMEALRKLAKEEKIKAQIKAQKAQDEKDRKLYGENFAEVKQKLAKVQKEIDTLDARVRKMRDDAIQNGTWLKVQKSQGYKNAEKRLSGLYREKENIK